MPKFIDKLNLPQYKYFNNMLVNTDMRTSIAADIFTASHQIKYGGKKGFMDAIKIIIEIRKVLPDFLFANEVDREVCRRELEGKDYQKLLRKLEFYAEIMLMLHFIQGYTMIKEREIGDEQIEAKIREGFTKQQIARMYLYKENRYYRRVTAVPKLVLINESLYRSYLMREFTQEEYRQLERLMVDDVNYIVNVQEETQKENVYYVQIDGKEKLSLNLLNKKDGLKRDILITTEGMDEEVSAVVLSLLDYLLETEKAEKKRKLYQKQDEGSNGRQDSYIPKYVDKNSIKVFDMNNSEAQELEVLRFRKRNGRIGMFRRTGYEMTPHTRKGHYRTYKNGKVVYVKSSVIHKDKFDAMQSAHRIN